MLCLDSIVVLIAVLPHTSNTSPSCTAAIALPHSSNYIEYTRYTDGVGSCVLPSTDMPRSSEGSSAQTLLPIVNKQSVHAVSVSKVSKHEC
eukprot:3620-Heterococcus_DN1.PRE.4